MQINFLTYPRLSIILGRRLGMVVNGINNTTISCMAV